MHPGIRTHHNYIQITAAGWPAAAEAFQGLARTLAAACADLLSLYISIFMGPNWIERIALVAAVACDWSILDKNHPWTAFLFDLSGILILVGVAGMIVRRFQAKSSVSLPGLPAADWPAYALLGSIIIIGYLLEGMRMAMTGSPAGASWAFVGDGVSRMLIGLELTGFYGYGWYLHALLTGAFVVYLPFSRMFHMIMAPVVLAMNAASSSHNGR